MGNERVRRVRNPYDWQGETKHFVGRDELLARAVEVCLEGEGVFLLLGTRGMGKSVFLTQLEAKLRTHEDREIVRFDGPPSGARAPNFLAEDIRSALLEGLLVQARRRGKAGAEQKFEEELRRLMKRQQYRELFETYLDAFQDEIESIVLLYDEFDRYADAAVASRAYFNGLEDVRKKLGQRLVVVAAGGIGMLSLKTVHASTIFTRADRKILEPFGNEEIAELAEPFGERLSTDVLETLRLFSGGNLLLVTYGLQKLWRIDRPLPSDVVEVFRRFKDDSPDFRASIRRAIFGFEKPEVPFHVWRSLKTSGGRLPRRELRAIRERAKVKIAIEDRDILDMLRAAGFIRMADSSAEADLIVAEIIPSILSFDERDAHGTRVEHVTLREQLRADLTEVMAEIHRMAQSFYRQGSKKKSASKSLVPEAVFAATLAIYLTGRGWKTDLEPTSGAGYADIKARYPARFDEEVALVEVKRWGGDVATIHDQVTSYFARGVTALATVVIADLKDLSWKDSYEQKCLTGKVEGTPAWKALESPPGRILRSPLGRPPRRAFSIASSRRSRATTRTSSTSAASSAMRRSGSRRGGPS